MAYQALYRKYRPSRFSEMVGQDHIVRALSNQIESGRIGHAYLFCGTRGTGKTSAAKIFAKAVNCESPVNGEPCGKCASCLDIAANSSMNVLEIDAASNNGVDNIRDIRDSVEYTPASGKYRVFIIDEAHMLSTAAFNALLKTLEEPPGYVIFILATTNPGKIPATIRSRCQRYDFRRLSSGTIMERLSQITKAEGIEMEDRALRYISYAADGAMRDALSLLEQCVSFFMGDVLTYEKTLDILGAMDNDTYRNMVLHIYNGETVKAVRLLDGSLMAGKDIETFFSDLIWHLRNLMLVKSGDDIESLIDISGENAELLSREAATVDMDSIMRYIRIFSGLLERFRTATQKRVLAEAAVIKACRPESETDIESLLSRMSILEHRLASGAFVQAPSGASDAPAVNGNAPAAANAPAANAPAAREDAREAGAPSHADDLLPEDMWIPSPEDPAFAGGSGQAAFGLRNEEVYVPGDASSQGAAQGSPAKRDITAVWDDITGKLGGPAASMLRGAEVSEDKKGRIVIRPAGELGYKYFSDKGHADKLKDIIREETGTEYETVFLKPGDDGEEEKTLFDPKLVNLKDIKIKYET